MSIITISGRQGSGKTWLAKNLADKLKYDYISVGDLQGEIAIRRGITINKLMELAKTDISIHTEMDKKTIELGQTKDNFVMEGWIAYHFIPKSTKIFLYVNPKIGAQRIFQDQRPDEPKYETVKEAQEKLKERLEHTLEGFQKSYGIDFLNPDNYDLIIDTSNLNKNQMLEKVLKNL